MARPTWSGVISFGLVSVPVKAYTATRDKDVRFHRIERDTGARIKQLLGLVDMVVVIARMGVVAQVGLEVVVWGSWGRVAL